MQKFERYEFKYVLPNSIINNQLHLTERDKDFVSSFAIPIVHPQRDSIVRDLQDKTGGFTAFIPCCIKSLDRPA